MDLYKFHAIYRMQSQLVKDVATTVPRFGNSRRWQRPQPCGSPLLVVYSMILALLLCMPCQGFLAVEIIKSTQKRITFGAEMLDSNEFLEQARKLRREASELEERLQKKEVGTMTPKITLERVAYSEVANSTWTIRYRFSDQPEMTTQDDIVAAAPRAFFSGEMSLLFRRDQYTELLSQTIGAKYNIPSAQGNMKVLKAWGWDIEDSDDGQEYIMFSIDATLPMSSDDRTTKFYFQARQERQPDDKILFKDGTVTVKKDVMDQAKGPVFGFLSPRGILARFVRVGDFIMTPMAPSSSNAE